MSSHQDPTKRPLSATVLAALFSAAAPLAGCAGIEGDLLTPLDRPDLAADLAPRVECTTAVLGSADTCARNVDLKAQAEAACAARGQVLADGGPAEACDAQTARFARFSCCPAALLGSCTHEFLGSMTGCADEPTWREQAAGTCAPGLLAQGFLPGDPCAGGSRGVRYLCCPG